jgi:hypothetical protein
MKQIQLNSKLLVLLLCTIFFISCEDERGYDDYDAERTTTVAMNGEWFVDIKNQAGGTALAQHIIYRTYDTSLSDGSMYIDNRSGTYIMRGKVNTDSNALTFSATNEANITRPGTTFTITEGKILKNAARSRSGNVVDSIYFRGVFSHTPGTTFIFSGHKRTGFLEDEY